MSSQPDLDRRIRAYYGGQFDEATRLTGRSAAGVVERERVREALAALLSPGSRVLDVGGGTGVHAAWLAGLGHDVTLVDPVPEHVAAAGRHGGFAAEVGDARALSAPDASVDAVLLLGPLYHLRSRADRLTALREAHRVLRPGGHVLAGAITRTVAAVDLVLAARFADLPPADLVRLLETGEVADDLVPGFPVAHLHTAEELHGEVADAGFDGVRVEGLEGPGSLALELVPATDDVVEAALLLARRAQGHPASADLAGHLLAVGTRPAA
ncbi:class I SAM-dependent methyltransferase [Cellulomonas triticagri]|uniref:Class I SAM-dependent methyltransferase n=1 Tax=Cellulomonas triticagri TaxID=2483352 RepID=A0A3M2JHN3_9CELL|nr:class I SAM-dependent methyltransferase [Cellulomonas triticagri]RMI12554.1 class I SAM-dependent methyltransferase [Cellulomonas triticagri]